MTEFEEEEAKYVVFKKEYFDQWQMQEKPASIPRPLDDTVVIRLKDPFAATALFTYANTIMSFLELMDDRDTITWDEHERMVGIADYFHQQACASQEIKDKRLPD